MQNRLRQLDRALSPRRGSRRAAALALILLLGLGVLDELTTFELSFSLLYLVPVLLAGWFGPPRSGGIMAALAASVWLTVDFLDGRLLVHPAVLVWNTAARFGFFLVIAALVAEVRLLLSTEGNRSRFDPVTGIANARSFREEGSRLLELARRHQRPLTVAYLDIDNFREVNDARGWGEGDRVLRAFAAILRSVTRSSDLPARMGDDEFAVLFPDTDYAGAAVLLDDLPKRVAGIAREEGWPISLSVGVMSFPTAPNSLEEALALAHELVHRVKERGKQGVLHEMWRSDPD